MNSEIIELQDQLNERAELFSKNFANADYEMGQAQNFVRELCAVYGLNYLRSVEFEHRIKKANGKGINRIDGFFAGLLLIEMKSAGANLEEAYQQAKDYIPLLKNEKDAPRHILVSDFQNLHLYDETGQTPPIKFKLADFRSHVNDLDFLLKYERIIQQHHEQASIEAATHLGKLHDSIKKTGYVGSDLQTLLVRLLFCLFAEDTDLFSVENAFYDVIQNSNSDGSDLGGKLQRLFKRLDTNPKDIDKNATQQRTDGQYSYLLNFPYINGQLFRETIAMCDFDGESRKALLECCQIDWSEISPDIFGALFQHIMHWDDEASEGKTKKRHDFGAHYTSERNILRAIEPLFLDELRGELITSQGDKKRLEAFVKKLQMLNIIDPACGCGNFLVVAYREIRAIEQQAITELNSTKGANQIIPQCDVHQFHGIEIDPTAVEIATVALWLTDHQMNRRWSNGYKRIPLHHKANIHCANALRINWDDVLPAKQCSYIVGNPPFLGKKEQNAEQKADMEMVFKKAKGTGVLDYVSAWYVKAMTQMKGNPKIKSAFVSTNSITQGEQVSVLWAPLFQQGMHIQFAHRTFKWSNEGSGVAAVHCIIIGFGMDKPKKCSIWDYSRDIKGNGKKIRAKQISPYLVDAPITFLDKRRTPISKTLEINYGSFALDDGNFTLSEVEKNEIIECNPDSKIFIRPFIGGQELLYSEKRYCLWLIDATNSQIRSNSIIKKRVDAVKAWRASSSRETTRKLSDSPNVFAEIRQPSTKFLSFPTLSSENRNFIPIAYLSPEVIASNQIYVIPDAGLFHFGILTSTMHNAWLRAVGGRLESRYRYSAGIVYNNFPWPNKVLKDHKSEIEKCANTVLEARKNHEGKSLAWLYNADTMPKNLQDAHDDLDYAVDEAFHYKGNDDDASRVAFLFEMYEKIISDTEKKQLKMKLKNKK